MYVGDLAAMLGFFLFLSDPVSGSLLLLGWTTIVVQAVTEDRALARTFPEEHAAWSQRAGLLWPTLIRAPVGRDH